MHIYNNKKLAYDASFYFHISYNSFIYIYIYILNQLKYLKVNVKTKKEKHKRTHSNGLV